MDDDQVLKAFQKGIDSILEVVHSLSNEIDSLHSEMSLLRKENDAIHVKIAELEARLNKNSKNSSKPPSSDGYSKPPVNKTNNSRASSGKSTGGQDNHIGHTIAFSEEPTKVVKIGCPTDTCTCGCCLNEVNPTIQKREVFDIPVYQ